MYKINKLQYGKRFTRDLHTHSLALYQKLVLVLVLVILHQLV